MWLTDWLKWLASSRVASATKNRPKPSITCCLSSFWFICIAVCVWYFMTTCSSKIWNLSSLVTDYKLKMNDEYVEIFLDPLVSLRDSQSVVLNSWIYVDIDMKIQLNLIRYIWVSWWKVRLGSVRLNWVGNIWINLNDMLYIN